MKLSVLGAGAIGSMFGGLIKWHDPQIDVWLIMRGEHGRVVCERGFVTLQGRWGQRDVSVNASLDVQDVAGSDCLLITVKSQATEEAIGAASPYLGDATVISVQNGFNDEVLARRVRPEKLVMGLTATNVTMVEPGTASLRFDGSIVVGPNPGRTNAAASKDAAALLRKTGLPVAEDENVLGVRYNKLAINAPGYASCLSQSNFITEAVCYKPWRQSVGMPLVDECIGTLQRAGISWSRIPGVPDIHRLRRFFRLLDSPLAGPFVALAAQRIFNRRPIVFSLYQDLLRGRGTEVDFTSGQIVQLARANGLDAPYNALVVQMAHELEARGPGCFFTREEVIRRFQQVGAPAAEGV